MVGANIISGRTNFWGWGSGLAVVLGAHAAGLWALLAPIAVAPSPPAAAAMMMVELGAPASIVRKDVELTPGVKQVRARPMAAPAKPQPVKTKIKERQVANTEAALPPSPPPTPQSASHKAEAVPDPDDSTATKATETTMSPAASAAPPSDHTTAPAPGLSRVSHSIGQIDWRDALLSHVQRHTRYPPLLQGRRAEGVAYVRIAMNCRGMVLEQSLYRKSGHRDLDAEAMATIQRAQPLPAPSEAPNDRVELVVPIHFSLR